MWMNDMVHHTFNKNRMLNINEGHFPCKMAGHNRFREENRVWSRKAFPPMLFLMSDLKLARWSESITVDTVHCLNFSKIIVFQQKL